jgi:hypothetical protein
MMYLTRLVVCPTRKKFAALIPRQMLNSDERLELCCHLLRSPTVDAMDTTIFDNFGSGPKYELHVGQSQLLVDITILSVAG